MGRQVVKMADDREAMRGGETTQDQGDAYVERLLKMIPAEVMAVYLSIQGILLSALSGQESQLQAWLWGTFAVLLVGNVLYLRRFNKVTDPIQYGILTLAFVIWVLTLGGPFVFLSFYEPFMGSIILVLFTFFAPVAYTGVDVN